MRRNLSIRAHSIYATLFLFAVAAQAAAPRGLDPEVRRWTWEGIQRTFVVVRRIFDVVKMPIG